MERPVMIPFRWVGHGLDIRTIVVDGQLLFAAEDIYLALELPFERDRSAFWQRRILTFQIATTTIDGLEAPDGEAVQLITADQVAELDMHRPMVEGNDFIAWFEDLLQQHLSGDRLKELVDGALPAEPGLREEVTYSVARAAKILSRDPVIDIGQERLFEAMRARGWIARDQLGTWIPSDDTLRAGWLVRRHVRLPKHVRASLYPQVRLTPAGIQELHRTLGGVADISLTEPEHLTLVELP